MINLTKFALKRPVTLLLALVTVLFFGLSAVLSTPMELTPEMNMPMMVVTAVYPGASPEDVNELVTKPIEDSVSTLSGIDTVSSYSQENIALILLQYNYGENMDTAYMNLKKNLDSVKSSLPDDAEEPNIMELDMNATPVMQITVSGGTDGNLYNYVNDNIVPELEKISSVGQVSLAGGRESYIRIELIPEKVKQYNLNMTTIGQLVGAADYSIPAGSVSYGRQDLNLSVGSNYKDIERIKNIVLPLQSGEVIHLSDVANVYNTLEDTSSLSRYNGEDVVTIAISKQQSASAVDVSTTVNKTIENLKARNETLKINVVEDTSDNIKSSLKSVFQTLIMAIILSMIVLFLFFGDIKASFIVGSSIPISVMIALTLMSAAGFTLNLVSVGSLVLGVGMIVDASIVVLESCFRAKENRNFYDTAIEGTRIVIASITGSTITTCVVFLPLALLQGLSGQLFKQLGFTIVFCMIASLFSATMIVPLMYFFLHPVEKTESPMNKIMEKLQNGYRRLVKFIMPKTAAVIIVSIAMLIVSFIMAGNVGMEMMPDTDQGQIAITVKTQPGLKIEEVDAIASKVEKIIADDPDTENYLFTYGDSGLSMMAGSSVSITAYLKDDRSMSTDKVLSKWKKQMSVIPDASISLESSSGTGMSMTNSNIEIDLQSTDYELLKKTADDIVSGLHTQPYITKVHSDAENSAPLVKVDIDPVKAQAVGLTPASVGGTVRTNLTGSEVMNYTSNGSEVSVKVENPSDEYESIEDVAGMMITTAAGTQVPLSDIADIVFEDSALTITRSAKQYQVAITGDIVEGYEATAAKSANAYVDNIGLPLGVTRAANAYDDMMADELGSLAKAILTAIFLVFIVMAMQFESPKFSLMVMFTIPFSLIGAFGLLWIARCKISMTSMLGFLMLVGTVVNNGILYVDTVNQYRASMDVNTALVEAGATRIRPILMTTLTTILAMVPMALAYGDSGEMLQGLALVNVGGLLASTILSLLLLPTFYRLVDKSGKKAMGADIVMDVD